MARRFLLAAPGSPAAMSGDEARNSVALRSFAVGAVSGGRSLTGLAAVVLSTAPDSVPSRVARLVGAGGRRAVVTGALGELVADKLPGVPSRLSPPALTGRVVLGAAAASLLAVRSRRNPVAPALLGAAGAVAGSVAGARWRALAQQRGWSPLTAAIAEDLVVLGLATALGRTR
jgi:uncharacterized membrane protein